MTWDTVTKQKPALGPQGTTIFQEAGQINLHWKNTSDKNSSADAQPVMAAATLQTLHCDSHSEGWVVHDTSPGRPGRNAEQQLSQDKEVGNSWYEGPEEGKIRHGPHAPFRPTTGHTHSSGP